jgi:anti-anti-sigma regulatory factor
MWYRYQPWDVVGAVSVWSRAEAVNFVDWGNDGPVEQPVAAVPAQRKESSPGRSGTLIVATLEAGARVTVKVVGDLDRAGVAALRKELKNWREAGVGELRLDLSEMSYFEPALARMLGRMRLQLRASGGHLIVTGLRAQLYAELERAARAGVGEAAAG